MEKQEKQEPKRLGGFYIALCCCVIAVGVAGYFTEQSSENTASRSDMNATVPQSEIVSKEEMEAVEVSESATDIEYEENTAVYEPTFPELNVYTPEISEDITENEAVLQTASIVTEPEFSMPVQGEILEEFSKELSYNNALCDWRAHTGVDIAGVIGASVNSIADGTVTKISSDEMGKYIEIDHKNGFCARYSRLLSTESCEVGKDIKSGEVIGTICEGSGENISEPHLHLELYKDGSAVNPIEYINQ